MSDSANTIVVGMDDSDGAAAALGWAEEEARRRHLPLRLVTGLEPVHFSGAWQHLRTNDEQQRDEAWGHLSAAVSDLELRGVQAMPVLHHGSPAQVLLQEAEGAALVVVGSRGRGGFTGLLLGSTSLHVAMNSPAPVIVVRPRTAADASDESAEPGAGNVVVGVDGTDLSEAAIEFAFGEADLRGVGLTAVQAWFVPDILVAMTSELDETVMAQEEEALLAELLAGFGERYPDVVVTPLVVRDDPTYALVTASAGAVLTVVGSRGTGGFRGMVIGSTSHAVLHHAQSPVAVVRTRRPS